VDFYIFTDPRNFSVKMKHQVKFLSALVVLLLAATTGKSQSATGYTKYVNTFVGTAPLTDPKILGYTLPEGWRSWAGLTFPGSSLPNAMVQLSPITQYGSGAGYEYEDSVIYGFTHTNKGHWNLCNIPILPLSNPGATFGSRFTHKK
jgi:putative alpha-1,2-mannosidase